MASKSKVSESSVVLAAAHTVARAFAAAAAMPASSSEVTASTARHAVACDATGPKSSCWLRSTARSDKQSAPSAMLTARWLRTTPGSWVCQEIPQSPIATDSASVRPDRSASSLSRAVPACDTRFSPSVVTFRRRTERVRFTFKEPSSWSKACL